MSTGAGPTRRFGTFRPRWRVLPTADAEPPAERSDTTRAASLARVVLLVLLPFVTGYYLSYLYRSINALISEALVSEFALSPANLGFLTATYLPCGAGSTPE